MTPHLPSLLLAALCTCTAAEAGPAAHARALTADLAWWNAHLIAQYRAVGDHGPWDAAAERFLSQLPAVYLDTYPRASSDTISALGMAAMNDGCRDPLVIMRTAMFYSSDDYGRSLVNWASGMLRSRAGGANAYSPLNLMAALRRQGTYPDQELAARARTELPDVVRRILIDELADAGTRNPTRRCLATTLEVLIDPEAVGAETAAAIAALLAEPGIDPWLGEVTLGCGELGAAWRERGEVPAQRPPTFRQHLAAARKHLTAAWTTCPELPRAAALMVTVAMDDAVDAPTTWAERAWAADPEDPLAYDRLAALSRHVAPDAFAALAMRAADGPWDGPLPLLAERLAVSLAEDLGAWNDPRVWKIFLAATAAKPGMPPEAVALLRTRCIAWAWQCGRRKEALEAFTAAGGLDAPWLEPGALPWFMAREPGPGLALDLRRMQSGQRTARMHPLPRDAAAHQAPATAGWQVFNLMPDWYARHGTHGPWDAQAALFLGPVLIQKWLGVGKSDPAWPTAATMLANGCNDPLVVFYAHAFEHDKDPARYRRQLDQDWQALSASTYPALAAYQPAWLLLSRLAKDPGTKEERQALQERYARTVALVVKQAGTSAPVAPSLHELIDSPDQDEGSLKALTEAVAQAGIDPVLADGLRGYIDCKCSYLRANGDPARHTGAWQAMLRLWKTWDATHDPSIAADMAIAAGLAGCPTTEIRSWFDLAIDGGMNLDSSWNCILSALCVNGRADDLVAIAEEIAELPAETGCHHRALPFLQAVLANPSLHESERVQRMGTVSDRVTTIVLARDLSPSYRTWVLHQRAAYAFFAGRNAEAQDAVTRLGADFDLSKFPRGIDTQRFQREITVSTAPPEGARPKGKQDDF